MSPTPGPTGDARLTGRFAFVAAVVAGILSVAVVTATGPAVFDHDVARFVGPLVSGIALYAAVAVYSGVMYGISAWSVLAVVIVIDPLLRLAGIAIALLADGGVGAAVWMSMVPYAVVLAVLLVALRRGGRARFELDVRPTRLGLNALRTVGGAVGIAVLVSGLPLLVGLSRGDATAAEVGTLVFVLILTRAPLVLAVLSLQSYFIVRLKTGGARLAPLLLALVVAVGAVLTLAGYLFGAPVIELLAGPDYVVQPALVAALVGSSVATAALGVTGAAVLARGRHGVYVAGWTVAAIVSVLLMFALPGSLEFRVTLALSVGPLVGLVIHLAAFAGRPGRG